MAPFFDLLNHDHEPNCKISGDHLMHLGFSILQLKATQDIEEGKELTINYGNFSNDYFLFNFGFLPEQN